MKRALEEGMSKVHSSGHQAKKTATQLPEDGPSVLNLEEDDASSESEYASSDYDDFDDGNGVDDGDHENETIINHNLDSHLSCNGRCT